MIRTNEKNQRLNFAVWIPVRWGEMTKYPFALPADLTEQLIFPLPTDSPGGGSDRSRAKGKLFDQVKAKGAKGNFQTTRPNLDQGSNQFLNPTDPNRQAGIGDIADFGANSGPTFVTFTDPSTISTPINITTDRQTTKQWDIKDRSKPTLGFDSPATIPGKVVGSAGGDKYTVEVFPAGLEGKSSRIEARQIAQKEGDTIPEGTPVHVVKSIIKREIGKGKFNQEIEWTIAVPVWLPETTT